MLAPLGKSLLVGVGHSASHGMNLHRSLEVCKRSGGCRNPMYVGVVVTVTGWAATFGSVLAARYAVLLALVFHLRVTRFEEPWAEDTFPDRWPGYRARVPRVDPTAPSPTSRLIHEPITHPCQHRPPESRRTARPNTTASGRRPARNSTYASGSAVLHIAALRNQARRRAGRPGTPRGYGVGVSAWPVGRWQLVSKPTRPTTFRGLDLAGNGSLRPVTAGSGTKISLYVLCRRGNATLNPHRTRSDWMDLIAA